MASVAVSCMTGRAEVGERERPHRSAMRLQGGTATKSQTRGSVHCSAAHIPQPLVETPSTLSKPQAVSDDLDRRGTSVIFVLVAIRNAPRVGTGLSSCGNAVNAASIHRTTRVKVEEHAYNYSIHRTINYRLEAHCSRKLGTVEWGRPSL